jgi:NDP-sugar pyrophosphorylase family protein
MNPYTLIVFLLISFNWNAQIAISGNEGVSQLVTSYKEEWNAMPGYRLQLCFDNNKIIVDEAKKKFLLLYSDNYCSLNLHHMMTHYQNLKTDFLITICKKKNNGNILINKKKNIVKSYLVKNKNSNLVEVGYIIIDKKIVLDFFKNKNESFNELLINNIKKKTVNYYLNDTG